MKKFVLALTVLLSVISFGKEKLTVYSYDSLSWIKEGALKSFEAKNDCNVEVVQFENTSKIVSRLKLEKKRTKADVVIGLNQVLTSKAKSEGLLIPYKSKNIGNIKSENLIFDKEYYVTPYDYGALAIVYNPEGLAEIPKTFEDLKKSKKSIIIQDPRNSTTGQDFLLWTIAVYGDGWQEFWRGLKSSILTVAPGWSESFAKFETGEAPMMVSYATDGAYSYEYYKSTKYKAFIPENVGFVQVEGLGIINGSKNIELAKKFIDYSLTEEFQNYIPLNQWMFPVIEIKLPESFKYALVPDNVVTIDGKLVDENLNSWLEEWEKIMY